MAAPIESYIQLPTDSGNTGKKVRAQSRVVGSNTVYSHFYSPITPVNVRGSYHYSPQQTLVAATAANGTTSALFWLQNPIDSTVAARIRKITANVCTYGTVDAVSTARFSWTRFTHNGGWSGNIVSVLRRKSTDPVNQCDIRSASTGTTVSLGATMWNTIVPGQDITSGGASNGNSYQFWQAFNEDDYVELVQGEGLVLYQADNCTASVFSITFSINWDEYENT